MTKLRILLVVLLVVMGSFLLLKECRKVPQAIPVQPKRAIVAPKLAAPPRDTVPIKPNVSSSLKAKVVHKVFKLGGSPSETHNMTTYDTTITYVPASSGSVWQIRITRPLYYFTTGNADTASRRVIVTMQGEGQVGTNPAILLSYGPHYWLNTEYANDSTWDGGVALSNGEHYPIYITVAPAAANVRPNYYSNLLHTLINEFHPRGGKIDMMGLSMGNQCNVWALIDSTITGTNTMMALVESVVDQEGENGSTYGGGYTSTFPNDMGHWAAVYHGHFLGLEGDADDRGVWQNTKNINDSLGAHGITNDSAYFSYQNFGGGGHGSSGTGNDGTSIDCWNYWWDVRTTNLTSTNTNINWSYQSGSNPHTIGTYTGPPENILQWVMRSGDTTLVGQGNTPPLAKTQKWVGSMGEYGMPFIDSLGRAVVFSGNLGLTGNNGSGTSGVPLPISSVDSQFVLTANTLHGNTFITAWGNVFVTGGNDQGQLGLGYVSPTPVTTLQQVTVDSRGIPFTNIYLAQGAYVQVGDTTCEGQFFVKHGTLSDSVFFAGRKRYGIGGDGDYAADDTLAYPTLMFSLASGQRITSLTGEQVMAYIRSDGTVWDWGSNQFGSAFGRTVTGTNYSVPVQVTGFDTAITQITGGGAPGFVALSAKNKLWGWGVHSGYLGNAANTSYNSPTDLTSSITANIVNGTTRTIYTQIVSSSTNYHALMNDGTIWFWGDKGMGNAGDGIEANLASPGGTSSPWFIDPSALLVLPQYVPEQITGQSNFVAIYGGQLFCFDFAALDINGKIYFCGRNKGSILPNGVVECSGDGGGLSSHYPNSWDIPYLTVMNPYGVTSAIQQGNYGCYTGAVTANCSSCGTTTSASANAGSNQTVTGASVALTGTASSVGGSVVYTVWTQLSGPTSVISLPSSLAPTVALTIPGSYVYQLSVQDQGFHTNTSSVTISYGSAAQDTFYFAPTGSGTSCSITAPCAFSYLTSISLVSGDVVAFQAGGTYNGSITVPVDGVTYTSYGTGARPIISGLTPVSLSTSLGSNLYAGYVSNAASSPNIFIVDGIPVKMGRYPNSGYQTFTAITSSSFTDVGYSGPSTTGASAVLRDERFCIDNIPISSYSSGVFTLSSAPTYTTLNGNGYFITNSLATLDTTNEWYFHTSVDSMFVYLPAGPSGHIYQTVATTYGLSASNRKNITINGLAFEGSNTNTLLLNTDTNVVVENCNIDYSAGNAIAGNNNINLQVVHCHSNYTLNDWIYETGSSSNELILSYDTVFNTGMIPGMGQNGGGGTYEAINAQWRANEVSYNWIRNTGYTPIYVNGDSTNVTYNAVDSFGFVKDDGGGIYMHDASLTSYTYPRHLTYNVITNGYVIPGGTTYDSAASVSGIYLDGATSQVVMDHNTVYNVNSNGIFIHGSNNTLTYNKVFGSQYAQVQISEYAGEGAPITGIVMNHNYMSSATAAQKSVCLVSVGTDIPSFGTINFNQFSNPSDTLSFYTQTSAGSTYRSFPSFQSYTGFETFGGFQLVTPTLYYSNTSGGYTFSLPGQAKDLVGTTYTGTVSLPAYTSTILYYFSPSGVKYRFGKIHFTTP